MDKFLSVNDINAQHPVEISVPLFGTPAERGEDEGAKLMDDIMLNSTNGEVNENQSSDMGSIKSLRTGSNRRKPKLVQRVINQPHEDEMMNMENLHFKEIFTHSPESPMDQRKGLRKESLRNSAADDSILRNAVDAVVSFCTIGSDTKDRLSSAIMAVQKGYLTIKMACEKYHLLEDCLNTYYKMVAEVLCDKLDDSSGTSAQMCTHYIADVGPLPKIRTARKDSYTVGPPLDPNDFVRVEKIENTVNAICDVSVYPADLKNKLRGAVLMVINGEYTLNAASNIWQLPSSTVHPYVHRARVALSGIIPPQVIGSNIWAKKSLDSDRLSGQTFGVNKVNEVINSLSIKCNDKARLRKIHDAMRMVLVEKVSLIEAAKHHRIPSGSFAPFVLRARYTLERPHLASNPSEVTHRQKDNCENSSNSGATTSTAKGSATGNRSMKRARPEAAFSNAECIVLRDGNEKQQISSSDEPSSSSSSRRSQLKKSQRPKKDTSLVKNVAENICRSDYDTPGSVNTDAGQLELRTKIYRILQLFDFVGNHNALCDATADVLLMRRSCTQVAGTYEVDEKLLSASVRLSKAFLDIERSIHSSTLGADSASKSGANSRTKTLERTANPSGTPQTEIRLRKNISETAESTSMKGRLRQHPNRTTAQNI